MKNTIMLLFYFSLHFYKNLNFFYFPFQAIAGIGPTIISIIVLFVFCQTWGAVVYPGLTSFPDWAHPVNNITNITTAVLNATIS